MAITYEDTDGTTNKLIEQVKKANHAPLVEHKVKLDAQFCVAEDEEPAIKVSGRETFGRLLIFKPDHRAKGAPDMRIQLDKAKWEKASTDEQEAQIDQLLQSVEIRMTSVEPPAEPEVIRDTAGRPKLKRVKPDLYLCGYSVIAKRHGHSSPEHATVKALRDRFNQLHLFDASEPSEFEKKAKGKGNGAQPTMQMAQ